MWIRKPRAKRRAIETRGFLELCFSRPSLRSRALFSTRSLPTVPSPSGSVRWAAFSRPRFAAALVNKIADFIKEIRVQILTLTTLDSVETISAPYFARSSRRISLLILLPICQYNKVYAVFTTCPTCRRVVRIRSRTSSSILEEANASVDVCETVIDFFFG